MFYTQDEIRSSKQKQMNKCLKKFWVDFWRTFKRLTSDHVGE